MALATYTDLQSSVAAWLHRSDLTALIPDFVALAEARMSGDLKSRSMEVRTSLFTVAGTATVALPADMVEMRRLTITSTTPTISLQYKTPDQLVEDNGYSSYVAMPRNFTTVGANVELSPIPDSVYTLELIYLQRIPALATNSTNWLLTSAPNAYLFGTLVAAGAYTQDEERIPFWERKYQEAVQVINEIDWYSGSTMRVRSR